MSELIEKLNNEHLVYWSAFLALLDTKQWQANHPTSKAIFHRNMLRRVTVGTPGGDRPVPAQAPADAKFGFEHIIGMVNEAKASDPEIHYTEDALKWFLRALESGDSLAFVFMFMRSVTPFEAYTPAEIAARTGTAESGWRNKCAAGQIEGAYKKGKQWLIPEYVLTVKHTHLPT